MTIDRMIGIDLGTTNSVVAMMDETNEHVITHTDRQGRHIIPSVVGVKPKTGEIITGYLAYSYRGTSNAPVVSIKRRMGSTELTKLGERELAADEISALIISECMRCMKAQLEKLEDGNTYDVTRAIITVPAYFDVNATDATRRAGEKAGLKEVQVLQEPTAAAMFYIWKHHLPDGNYLVFDLGGGTFDVSLVNMTMGVATVLGLSGNNFLGGDDFDKRLARDLLHELQDSGEYTLDLTDDDTEDRLRMAKLVLKAEELKKELSSKSDVLFESSNIFEDQEGRSVRVDISYTRERFEALIEDLVQGAMRECDKAIQSAVMNKKISGLQDIQQVLLVGGSTKVPLVKRRVEEKFCKGEDHVRNTEILCDEPDFAVGYGAALCATSGGTVAGDAVKMRLTQDLFEGSLALSGQIEGISATEGYRVTIRNGEGRSIGTGKVQKSGAFSVDDMDVDGLQDLTAEVVSPSGSVALKQPFKVAKTSQATPPPLVMPMDINLDVWSEEDKQVVKRTLIKRLTPLPIACEHTLRANEGTRKRMLFRLYQGYDPMIDVEVIPKRELKPGEPVLINVECDQTFRVTIEGNVGGEDVNIEARVAEKVYDPDKLRAEWKRLRAEFEKRLQLFSGGERGSYMAEEKNLSGAIEDGFEDNEMPKVSDKLSLYTDLVERMRVLPFDPPQEEFVKLVMTVRMIVARIGSMREGAPPDFSESEVLTALARVNDAAMQAYESKDRKLVKECFDKLRELGSYVYQIMQGPQGGDDEEAAEKLKRQINTSIKQLEAYLAENNPKAEVRQAITKCIKDVTAIRNGIYEAMPDSDVSTERRKFAGIMQMAQGAIRSGGDDAARINVPS